MIPLEKGGPEMAFSEFELKLHDRALQRFMGKRRPPPEIRDQVDLAYRIDGQSVVIVEVRPHWRRHGEVTERPIAKTTYVKSRGVWKILRRRADLQWHSYDPAPEVASLEEFLEIVDRDQLGAFFG